MDPTVRISGDGSDNEIRALYGWLRQGGELVGRLTLSERPPDPEQMGTGLDALQVALGSGGAVSALAGGVLTWLRARSHPVAIELKRADGASVSLSSTVVRAVTLDELSASIDDLVRFLDAGSAGASSEGPSDPPGTPPNAE